MCCEKTYDDCLIRTGWSGIPVMCYFVIVFILVFSIPCGRYDATKGTDERVTPLASIIALHWMTMFAGIYLGVALFLHRYGPNIGWINAMCAAICLAGFWGAYIGVFYVNSAWGKNYECISLKQFQEMYDNARAVGKDELYMSVYAEARKRVTRKSWSPCKTQPVIIGLSQSLDDTQALEITEENIGSQVYLIQTQVNIYADEEGSKYLTELRNLVGTCTEEYGGVSSMTGVQVEGTIQGLKEWVLVTKDGKLPSAIKRSTGGVAGFFAAGIVYSYDFARLVKVQRLSVNKYVELNITENYEQCTSRLYKCITY